jgi:hypothetical protein
MAGDDLGPVFRALADPTRIRFVRLARLAPGAGPAGEIAMELLRAALDSDAFGGRACAEALLVLLRARALAPDDPQAEAAYARAPAGFQTRLLAVRAYLGEGDSTYFLSALRALLVHPDEAVAVSAFETWSFRLQKNTPEGWLRALLPEMRNAKVRDYLREELGEPTEAELYWVDADDDADDVDD